MHEFKETCAKRNEKDVEAGWEQTPADDKEKWALKSLGSTSWKESGETNLSSRIGQGPCSAP